MQPHLGRFMRWAYGRHQNLLSWYIRPFFLLPLAYYAHRRHLAGIFVTLLALATSMFWFPRPKHVDRRVEEFLRFEQDYLSRPWTPIHALLTATVPISLWAFCFAFWRRSLRWGLVVMNGMAVAKVAWSLASGGESGRTIVAPAVVGLVACNGAIVLASRARNGWRAAPVLSGLVDNVRQRGAVEESQR
jgi:hypothetical protein